MNKHQACVWRKTSKIPQELIPSSSLKALHRMTACQVSLPCPRPAQWHRLFLLGVVRKCRLSQRLNQRRNRRGVPVFEEVAACSPTHLLSPPLHQASWKNSLYALKSACLCMCLLVGWFSGHCFCKVLAFFLIGLAIIFVHSSLQIVAGENNFSPTTFPVCKVYT